MSSRWAVEEIERDRQPTKLSRPKLDRNCHCRLSVDWLWYFWVSYHRRSFQTPRSFLGEDKIYQNMPLNDDQEVSWRQSYLVSCLARCPSWSACPRNRRRYWVPGQNRSRPGLRRGNLDFLPSNRHQVQSRCRPIRIGLFRRHCPVHQLHHPIPNQNQPSPKNPVPVRPPFCYSIPIESINQLAYQSVNFSNQLKAINI